MTKGKCNHALTVLKDGVKKATYQGTSCFPENGMLRAMSDQGYKFKLDGKAASPKQVMLIKGGVANA